MQLILIQVEKGLGVAEQGFYFNHHAFFLRAGSQGAEGDVIVVTVDVADADRGQRKQLMGTQYGVVQCGGVVYLSGGKQQGFGDDFFYYFLAALIADLMYSS